jgi:RNA polymerase sigma-70 factor, ECF subfamily
VAVICITFPLSGIPRAARGHTAQVTPDRDDRDLVARARRGDTGAFEQLVRRYGSRVYRIALRILGDRAAADDAAQEAFITAWRHISEIRAEAAFRSWLLRITTSRAVDAARDRRHDIPIGDDIWSPAGPPDPEAAAVAAGLRAALTRALDTLTPRQRACWVLKEAEGMSYDEIAGIARTTPDAVRGRIHRARARLAKELAPWR